MRTQGEATEGMEKIATHGSIQKGVMDAMVKKIAMGVSNQRTTNTVGNQECRCATEVLWNGLFTSAIVRTTQSVDSFHSDF